MENGADMSPSYLDPSDTKTSQLCCLICKGLLLCCNGDLNILDLNKLPLQFPILCYDDATDPR